MRFRIPAVLAVTAFAVGCLDEAEIDENETIDNLVTETQRQDYDPSNSVIPFPNVLLLSPTTGTNALPATCGESAGAAALRQGTLNTLDGVGTWQQTSTVTFTSQVSLASASEHVYLVKVGNPATAAKIPVVIARYQTLRYEESLPTCGASNVVEGIAIVPTQPLDDDAFYVVAITQGVTGEAGEEFQPSTAWAFSRQLGSPVGIYDINGDGLLTPDEVAFNNTPVDAHDPRDEDGNGIADTLETLAGIQQLYTLNQSFIQFADDALDTVTETTVNREDILIAWMFKTQTVEAPLDPAASGPASHVADEPFNAGFGPAAPDVVTFYEAALGAGICTQLPCAALSAVMAGTFDAQNYQVPGPNTGTEDDQVLGPWGDPLNPSEATAPSPLVTLAFIPAAAAPEGGYPTVIFGHGITRSKGDLAAIAAQLAAVGIASVSTDWPQHGDRAVQIYPTGSACQSAGDAGEPDPTLSPACFQPILSSNLAATRDNVRQGVVDVLRLVEVLKHCEGGVEAGCNGLNVDPTKIGYIGQSLGSIIGTMPVSTSHDIKAAVFNVPAVSWLTILENTDSNGIKCPLFDALINNGTLTGNLWQQADGTFNTTDALCIQNDTTKPVAAASLAAYRTFASAARWILDPADGVNFLDRMGARVQDGELAVLVQEVQGDIVIPNEATNVLGAFLGFSAPTPATTPTSGTFTASAGLDNAAIPAHWLIYVPAATAVYGHGSLLQPAEATIPGSLGTGQMQTDAITFLATHLLAE